ncbi:MAG: N-acetyltransferase [Candidatus Abyssobacteria bacterium SURF_17]|uniref:N-acetyltransferase n=1 Tax=Candidatus Abyssobacteria bacterium SURF_17 TaxID=2093361 RepID=A0A419F1T8_9BACT|nr:MAG: N-acetyltransferase [Candidatus Abyssubacteria bacterium SURF_17]
MVRKARMHDVTAIRDLISRYSQRGDMLPKALLELYEDLRDFFVCVNGDGQVIGCCALHLFWSDLAEIQSLAVEESDKGKGIGTTLVQCCLDEARSLGILRVFTLTNKPAFFEKQGFEQIDRSELPHKIWAACVKCVKFPDCDEVALVLRLE